MERTGLNPTRRLLPVLLAGALSSLPAAAQLPGLSLAAVPVCYNFGCSKRSVIRIVPEDWAKVAGWFVPPPADAREERERIRRAVGYLEVIAGQQTPTRLDKARNDLLPSDAPGQLDCIDESLNTTTYLRLLEREGLLKWHRVLDRAYRRALLDQHWAGQIEEIKTGRRFVVDSWFADNGYLPFVQETEVWADIPFFGTSFGSTF